MNRTILGFIRKEFIQALRDPKMRIILFVLPLIQLTLFGVAISTEVKNIRLAAVYEPNDRLADRLYQRCLSSGWFLPAELPPGAAGDPTDWVKANRADAVLVMPRGGLQRTITRGEGKPQLLVNATNVIKAQQTEAYVSAVLREVLPASALAPPLALDVRVLYNPALITAVYMIPGVMSMILCVLTIILTSMALAREKESGTFETLISAPVSTGEILLGKTLPYIVLAMIDVPLILLLATLVFKVPVRGPLWQVFVATLAFVCTTVSIGTLISTIARSQQQAMMGGFLFLFPSVLFSGIMFPIENMPFLMKWLAALNPMKYFVSLLRNIFLKGGDPDFVLWNVGVLCLMAVITVFIAVRRFKHTLE